MKQKFKMVKVSRDALLLENRSLRKEKQAAEGAQAELEKVQGELKELREFKAKALEKEKEMESLRETGRELTKKLHTAESSFQQLKERVGEQGEKAIADYRASQEYRQELAGVVGPLNERYYALGYLRGQVKSRILAELSFPDSSGYFDDLIEPPAPAFFKIQPTPSDLVEVVEELRNREPGSSGPPGDDGEAAEAAIPESVPNSEVEVVVLSSSPPATQAPAEEKTAPPPEQT